MSPSEVKQRCEEKYYHLHPSVFRSDVESCFPYFKDYPEEVQNMIHSIAYDRGHAGGYGDVFEQYFDLVDLVHLTWEQMR